MKKLYNYLFFTTIILFLSCTEERDDLVVNSLPTSPTLAEISNSTINLVNLQNLPDNPAITLTWSAADYGVQTPINYDVEISNTDTFENVATFSNNNQRTISWSVSQLNVAAQKIGLPVEVESDLYVRVVASLGNDDDIRSVSNTAVLKVTTYFAYLFKDYYLVGAATQPGWDNNNNNPPLFRTVADENKYSYTGYFNADEFKVLEFLGQWQPQWGTDDGTTLSGNPATRSDDPSAFNISARGNGYYTFTFNVGNKTFSIEDYDDTNSTDFSDITVKGSASSTDISLTQSSFDSHLWYTNGVDLMSGSINFVDNNGGVWGNTTEFNGKATPNGGDIPITERNYNIWFNDLTGEYMIIPTF
ncbi:SusE domain-containing protein [Polaribacter porphyrae]|nr:SusE domain-containing protein [Polaribacter porphyrae]